MRRIYASKVSAMECLHAYIYFSTYCKYNTKIKLKFFTFLDLHNFYLQFDDVDIFEILIQRLQSDYNISQ